MSSLTAVVGRMVLARWNVRHHQGRCVRTIRAAYCHGALPQSARARVLVPQQAVAVEPDGGLHDRGTDKQLCQTEAGGEEEHDSPCARCRELQAHGLGDHNANDDGKLGENAWVASL